MGSMSEQAYRALIVDDDPPVLKTLRETLVYAGFEVRAHVTAEALLDDLYVLTFEPSRLPDVVVVDLRLGPRGMDGLQLIQKLAEKNLAAPIVAISAHYASAAIEEAHMSGAVFLGKPFGTEFATICGRLARIGRRKREYVMGGASPDASRFNRDAFLSFERRDAKLANCLMRNLEARGVSVWYAPDMVNPGDPWRRLIQDGIDQTSVLLPILTWNYVESPHCIEEYKRFRSRMDLPAAPLLLLPIVVGDYPDSPDMGLLDHARTYHAIDMSMGDTFIDRLVSIVLRIQGFLGQ